MWIWLVIKPAYQQSCYGLSISALQLMWNTRSEVSIHPQNCMYFIPCSFYMSASGSINSLRRTGFFSVRNSLLKFRSWLFPWLYTTHTILASVTLQYITPYLYEKKKSCRVYCSAVGGKRKKKKNFCYCLKAFDYFTVWKVLPTNMIIIGNIQNK